MHLEATMSHPADLPEPTLQTRLLHSDQLDASKEPNYSVAPMLSLSTTFRAPHPDSELGPRMSEFATNPQDPPVHVYSRFTQSTTVRTEKVLSSLLGANAITYASGLQAATAMLNYFSPSTIAIRRGYQGVHETIKVYARGRNVRVIDLDDELPDNAGELAQDDSGVRIGGTVVWVETPLNPTGEARDIAKYVQRAHAKGAYVVVDSTFAPPPLQNPLDLGVDMVFHSATKYMGGHSDLLAGVIAVREKKELVRLWHDRAVSGGTPGSLESYLLLRSLRTLPLRVNRQAGTAAQLVQWLQSLTVKEQAPAGTPEEISNGRFISRVYHSSLQPRNDKDPAGISEGYDFDPTQQMPGGNSPTFSIFLAEEAYAKYLPHYTTYFIVRILYASVHVLTTAACDLARWCGVARGAARLLQPTGAPELDPPLGRSRGFRRPAGRPDRGDAQGAQARPVQLGSVRRTRCISTLDHIHRHDHVTELWVWGMGRWGKSRR